MQYYGTRLSENISRREPEGYLLCLNVPVARTGTQEYLPEELAEGPDPPPARAGGKPVPVFRPEGEVFSPETIASFEGMPVTNDHPPDGVDVENIRRLQAGHAHNVRRGAGAESDLLLADLIITDPRLIEAILAGKREISCGYTYELCRENGRYIQRKIRGNHIAVVEAGRAGPRVRIRDEQASKKKQPERSDDPMKKSLTKLLARMAKDGDIETVAEFIGEMIDPADPAAEPAEAPEAEVTVEAPENREVQVTVDDETLAGILQRLDRLIELLAPLPEGPSADEDPGESASGEEVPFTPDPAEEIAEIVEEILEPVVSAALEEEPEGDECAPEEQAQARDALRAALQAVRPALAKMPPRQRQQVCADIAARLKPARAGRDSSIYTLLAAGRRGNTPDSGDLGRRIMRERNPHVRR